MIEAFVGVLFAACFVTVYLLISLLRRRGDEHRAHPGPELYPPALPGQNVSASNPALFRKTDELSRHHLAQGRTASRKLMTAGSTEQRPAPEGQS